MLSESEKKEIIEAIQHYEKRADSRSACIDALKIVQKHRGWVSDEGIRDVAEILHMSPSEVDGVATFYNLIFRKPVGKNVILLCDSVSCWVMGYEEIRRRISEHLKIGFGETTPDGEFTLLPIPCLGCCDHAPACVMGEKLHADLKPETIAKELGQWKNQ